MKRINFLIISIFIGIVLFLIPSISNATNIDVTRNVNVIDGSMEFNFNGLTLDTTHIYEFGLTKTTTAEVENWHSIKECTESAVTVKIPSQTPIEIMPTTSYDLQETMQTTDTGYVTIKDTTSNEIVLQSYCVDLKTPYLKVTSYSVIPNGKNLDFPYNINVASRNKTNSTAYYQYEKITDQNLINKYNEIKLNNGDYMELESMLKPAPSSNWIEWDYWNGHISCNPGFGYPQIRASVPDSGLYYMWVSFSGNNVKDIYGCILVDNLHQDIALDSISLPETATVELGKTLTLTPTFNPSNATNKIITWNSSDETIATIDNSGEITPKKIGSTIITVNSQDGSKQATCTVTVIETNKDVNDKNSDINNDKITKTEENDGKEDDTMASGKLPQTGQSLAIVSVIAVLLIVTIIGFKLTKKYRGIK